MSTCFLPVAADLRVGDEVMGIGSTTFASPRTVSSVSGVVEGLFEVVLDGSLRVWVAAGDGVDLTPPF